MRAGDLSFYWCYSYGHSASKVARTFCIAVEEAE